MPEAALNSLRQMRQRVRGERRTHGLSDEWIERFLGLDPLLTQAIREAATVQVELAHAHPEWFALDELALIARLQQHYVPFYEDATVNPFVPLAARGPWVVTSHGAVVHDSGGYGMLGFGHSPEEVLRAMAAPQVMANIMTAAPTQAHFAQRLRAEIGHTRGDESGCPYQRFVCLNSGSEAVTVALRIADINAKQLLAERHVGKQPVLAAMRQGFHGRTDRPARASHSSLKRYRQHLASFRDHKLLIVEPNDIESLEEAFAEAAASNLFIEALLVEPVMGEGQPGHAMTRQFYDAARRLTREHGTLLLVDSIQAGLRAHGVLSVVDYPGFEDAEPPDMETYSKALNAGQYPLSVLALREEAAALYVRGLYGNTMTTNPRALSVGAAVLSRVTPELRRNIRERGAELLGRFEEVAAEFPEAVLGVEGTGLLLAMELEPTHFAVIGHDGIEMRCRRRGIGLIHGGRNALRFTPHFYLSSAEIELIVHHLREVLAERIRETQSVAKATAGE